MNPDREMGLPLSSKPAVRWGIGELRCSLRQEIAVGRKGHTSLNQPVVTHRVFNNCHGCNVLLRQYDKVLKRRQIVKNRKERVRKEQGRN